MGNQKSKTSTTTTVTNDFKTRVNNSITKTFETIIKNSVDATCSSTIRNQNVLGTVVLAGNGNKITQSNDVAAEVDCKVEQATNDQLKQALNSAVEQALKREIDSDIRNEIDKKIQAGVLATGTQSSSDKTNTNVKTNVDTYIDNTIKTVVSNQITNEVISSAKASITNVNMAGDIIATGDKNSFTQSNKVKSVLKNAAVQKAVSNVISELNDKFGVKIDDVSKNDTTNKNKQSFKLEGIAGICGSLSLLLCCIVVIAGIVGMAYLDKQG